MGQARAKKMREQKKNMTKGYRFQEDAQKIVEYSQFLQEHEGARWARVPVDGGGEYIALMFSMEHWTIINGELYYHPSGTFSGDEMVFESVEPVRSQPSQPFVPNSQIAPQSVAGSLYNGRVRFFLNQWGMLQVVPNEPMSRTPKHP